MWTYNYTPSSDELYHWGIKGMRWGVRRYQKKDGSLTPAGKERYSNDESPKPEPKKSKHREALEFKFKVAGMSDEEAAKQADKRIRTEKILAAAGVVTVAAATTYVVRKHLKEKSDDLIKAGDSLQRISMSGRGELHDVFYAAKDKSDKTKYAGMLGITRQNQVGKAYMMDIGVQKDIKVAGRDKSLNVFKKLYETDSDFKRVMDTAAAKNTHGGNWANGDIKKMYDNFNSKLYTGQGKDPSINKFFDALKSEGYGAVRDVNDMKFSGYKAKNPLIVFGQSDNVMVKTFKELSRDEALKNLAKDGARETAKGLAKTAAVGVPVSSMLLYADAYQEPTGKMINTVAKTTGRKK